MTENNITPKTLAALRLLEGTSPWDTRSAKSLARLLWPEKLNECNTSLRRGGYYRAAGGYFSKLMKKGLVMHRMTDYDSGYYLTVKGERVLSEHSAQNSSRDQESLVNNQPHGN